MTAEVTPYFFVEMEEDFAIGLGTELMTALDQCSTKLTIVKDLSIEH
jgi:hypothetical protein